jgi:hypothetical protein
LNSATSSSTATDDLPLLTIDGADYRVVWADLEATGLPSRIYGHNLLSLERRGAFYEIRFSLVNGGPVHHWLLNASAITGIKCR